MDFLHAEHTGNNMFLMGAILADLYMRTLAETGRKERGLPYTFFSLWSAVVIVAHSIEHGRHDRIHVMGRRGLSDVLYAQFSGYGRPYLVYVQAYALDLRRIGLIICQVFSYHKQ